MLVPEYRHKGKLDVVWCGPYKVLEVLNKFENVKLDIPAPFDGLRVLNRDSIKPPRIPFYGYRFSFHLNAIFSIVLGCVKLNASIPQVCFAQKITFWRPKKNPNIYYLMQK